MKLFDGFDDVYLEGLRSGKPETEAHFIRYFSELILVKLRGRIPSRAVIDDVSQETFLRVFRALRAPGGIREPERLGPFVNAVCNNVLREQCRSHQRDAAAPVDEVSDIRDPMLDVEGRLLEEERDKSVRVLVHQLPEPHRGVLQALLDGKEKDDLCASLGVNRDYFRVVLHRAKRSFRTRFAASARPTVANPVA